jgi:hypothetical protein
MNLFQTRYIFSSLLFLAWFFSFSQDTIRYKNGQFKIARVLEVEKDGVRFLKYGTETPVINVFKYELESISYADGKVERFNVAIPEPAVIAALEAKEHPYDSLKLKRNKFYYKGRRLNEELQLPDILSTHPQQPKIDLMLTEFKSLEKNKKRNTMFLIAAFALTAAPAALGANELSEGGDPFFAGVCFGIGGFCGIGGNLLAFKYRKQYHKKQRLIVETFNNRN